MIYYDEENKVDYNGLDDDAPTIKIIGPIDEEISQITIVGPQTTPPTYIVVG